MTSRGRSSKFFARARHIDDDDDDVASPDVATIRQLKQHLVALEYTRTQKNLANDQRNAALAARDQERDRIFHETYQSEEELARLEQLHKLKILQQAVEDCTVEEDDVRGLLEEEETQTYRLITYNHHLSLITLTVSIVSREVDRRARTAKAEEEAIQRMAIHNENLRRGLLTEATEAYKLIVKQESAEFKLILAQLKPSAKEAEDKEAQRHQEAIEAEEAARQERIAQMDREQQEEVDEEEKAYEAALARLTAKYLAQRESLPEDPTPLAASGRRVDSDS